jgi:hypothetical protein
MAISRVPCEPTDTRWIFAVASDRRNVSTLDLTEIDRRIERKTQILTKVILPGSISTLI